MAYQKLGRDSSARKALFRDMVTDLFIYERIQTTEAKAKEVRSIAEKLITLAKPLSFVVKQLVTIKMQFKSFSLSWQLVTLIVQVDTLVFLN
jgi:ribosomal protein L17